MNVQFVVFVVVIGYVMQVECEGVGLVFVMLCIFVLFDDLCGWWYMIKGVDWCYLWGFGSDLVGYVDELVVQVSFEDVVVYVCWVGGMLLIVVQWECVVCGGQYGLCFVVSWIVDGKGYVIVNYWDGVFLIFDIGEDGYVGIVLVGCYLFNGWGFVDMIGNVWEWLFDQLLFGCWIIKGGLFLCVENYCVNYCFVVWQVQEYDFGVLYIGFCVVYLVLLKLGLLYVQDKYVFIFY